MKKLCKKCGESKSESDYYLSRSKTTNVCKECTKKGVQKRYYENREEILKSLRDDKKKNPKKWNTWKENKRVRRTEVARALKEGKPCTDCGGIFHFAAMDFDHVDPNSKGYNANNGISLLSLNKKKIEEELTKCEIVCANCHRVRTYKRNLERIENENSKLQGNRD